MSVKYTVKRNSLSSKWGVWSTDASSTVGKLLAELKSSEQAESYLEQAEAGTPHDAIMASLNTKKSKNGGGGLFGKMFKRGAAAQDEKAALQVSNPVIEIEAARKQEVQQEDLAVSETIPEPAPAPVVKQAPSRFQVIEQTPAPPTAPPTPKPAQVPEPAPPVVEPVEVVATAEDSVDRAETEDVPAQGEKIRRVVKKASLSAEIESALGGEQLVDQSDPVEAEHEPAELVEPITQAEIAEMAVEDEIQPMEQAEAKIAPMRIEQPETPEPAAPPVAQPEKPISPEPPAAAPRKVQPVGLRPAPVQPPAPPEVPNSPSDAASQDENSLLVDWSFTPPPDVTPEELRASGQQPPVNPAPAPSPEVAPPAVKIDPELSQPVAKVPKQPLGKNLDSGRISVDICVSKALKESASGDPGVSDKKYNSIASKEYTEVSKAFASGNSQDHLREELTHLAAVCIAWADAIEKRRTQEKRTNAA